jgi:hypothetical protein
MNFSKTFAAGLLATGFMIVSTGSVQATALPANTPLPGVALGTDSITGILVADTGVQNYSTPNETGTYRSQVYQEAGGTLDFVYLIDNDRTSIDSLSSVTMGAFGGFTLDASYVAGTGTVAADTVARLSAGSIVKFLFNNGIAPGQTADTMIIKTDAKYFVPGSYSAQDGYVAQLSGFAPTTVPEPMTYLLLGGGLSVLGLLKRKKA